jgi:hypothetical protein
MPGTPTKKKQAFSLFADLTGRISEVLGIDGVKTATESLSAYTQLESAMKQINLNSTLTLREKKNVFLQQAPGHIAKLTTTDLIKLYSAYRNDAATERKYAFIYSEDTGKAIGWIKHSLFDIDKPTGNTETHKKFLGLLKERALANIERHNREDAQRNFLDNREELINLRELMGEDRGRIPNLFSDLECGLEGKFKTWQS